jgi:hypothetical protein
MRIKRGASNAKIMSVKKTATGKWGSGYVRGWRHRLRGEAEKKC